MILQYKSREQVVVGYQQDMMERLCQEQRRMGRQTKCGRGKENRRNGERMDRLRHRISRTKSASASARYSSMCAVEWCLVVETIGKLDCFLVVAQGAHGRFKGHGGVNLSKSKGGG